MTDRISDSIDLRPLKDEARRRARQDGGPSYCQALDSIARDAGHPHWKALVGSVVDVRRTAKPADPSAAAASADAARRRGAKINAWISRALGTGSAPDPLSFHAALRDRTLSMEDRISAVVRSLGPLPAVRPEVHDAAVLLVAAIAHDAGADGDASSMPWRSHCRNLTGDDVLRVVEGMWSAGPAARHDDPQGEDAWIARTELSTSTWFARMALDASEKGRTRLAETLSSFAAGDHARRLAVLDVVRPLRLLMEHDRARFETMLAERYAARTSATVDDHREDARATVDVLLEDERIAFGDPSMDWDRAHANELADADMEHWEP